MSAVASENACGRQTMRKSRRPAANASRSAALSAVAGVENAFELSVTVVLAGPLDMVSSDVSPVLVQAEKTAKKAAISANTASGGEAFVMWLVYQIAVPGLGHMSTKRMAGLVGRGLTVFAGWLRLPRLILTDSKHELD